MKIVLIGYMASGKSRVGKVLAIKKGLEFKDLDDYIEAKEKKSISQIFKDSGEVYFRNKETECLKELLEGEGDFILSLGGGTPCYGSNMEIVLKNSTSFYLKTSIATIYSRLINEQSKRPLVAEIEGDDLKEFIAKHLFERAPFYEQASKIVSTDERSVDEVVDAFDL